MTTDFYAICLSPCQKLSTFFSVPKLDDKNTFCFFHLDNTKILIFGSTLSATQNLLVFCCVLNTLKMVRKKQLFAVKNCLAITNIDLT